MEEEIMFNIFFKEKRIISTRVLKKMEEIFNV